MSNLVYFVSDVHLGSAIGDPQDRERRFVDFLKKLPHNTSALYLLGDIWDFWYEYRDVVPKGYVRVLAALVDLIDRGVEVYYFRGNHDVWTYKYFEELGIKFLEQPYILEMDGKRFCLGHGDGLGPVPNAYRFMNAIFHCKFLQSLFSMLHPWIAFRFGNNLSKHNRLMRKKRRKLQKKNYEFRYMDEPICKFAEEFSQAIQAQGQKPIDYFIFGHYHKKVEFQLPSGVQFRILKDWYRVNSFLCWNGEELIWNG